VLRIDGAGMYSVWVTTQQGCALEFETEFEQECQEAIYAPNSFTPDGDGINDAWFVYGVDVVNYQVQIYNRWGEMFFDSHDILVPWLGQRRDGNQYVDSEVYDYVIRYQKVQDDESLSPEVMIKGSIALIR
jgi:gliding motility-associated-like protein